MSGSVTGDLCGDGSGVRVQTPEFARCGWSVCQVAHVGDGEGTITVAMHGPLPGRVQEVPLAELYAFFMAVSHALPPITYWSDCQFVVDGFKAGREGTTKGCHAHADLWKRVWDKIDDVGLADDQGNPLIRVLKVKAHTSRRAVAQGTIKQWQQDGNRHADATARRGAAMHPVDEEVLRKHEHALKYSTFIAKYIGRILARIHRGPYDAAPMRQRGSQVSPGPRRRKVRTKNVYKHTLAFRDDGLFACWSCGAIARSEVNLTRRPCLRNDNLHSHTLWSLNGGRTIFCARCGCRSTQRLKQLKGPCKGKPSSPSMGIVLRDLKLGKNPGSKTSLGPPMPFVGRSPPGCVAVSLEGNAALLDVDTQIGQLFSTRGFFGEAPADA